MMTVHEIADYLRVKERKIYDLITQKQIPCTRVTGKWLFSRHLIDLWLMNNSETSLQDLRFKTIPEIMVGSHDPLLEWALRESVSAMAMQTTGSLEGLSRFSAGEAMICAMHVLDVETGEYNVPVVKQTLQDADIVVLEWAWRGQGLIVARNNPLAIQNLADLLAKQPRLVIRQNGSGSRILLDHLLEKSGIAENKLNIIDMLARTEMEVGLAISGGRADVGLAVSSVAKQLHLDFIPLAKERFDLIMRRFDYFEPPIQKMLVFCQSIAFADKAKELGDYDIRGLGRVVYNKR
ncbi:substrate-binding domain-containing protein [Methyloglobulus sp.]|uniref:substrate-binding domain-containing protein n=1 Tax=Methyloglobulus sp. TaxID=2518622 RepID=UPI00398A3A5E